MSYHGWSNLHIRLHMIGHYGGSTAECYAYLPMWLVSSRHKYRLRDYTCWALSIAGTIATNGQPTQAYLSVYLTYTAPILISNQQTLAVPPTASPIMSTHQLPKSTASGTDILPSISNLQAQFAALLQQYLKQASQTQQTIPKQPHLTSFIPQKLTPGNLCIASKPTCNYSQLSPNHCQLSPSYRLPAIAHFSCLCDSSSSIWATSTNPQGLGSWFLCAIK